MCTYHSSACSSEITFMSSGASLDAASLLNYSKQTTTYNESVIDWSYLSYVEIGK